MTETIRRTGLFENTLAISGREPPVVRRKASESLLFNLFGDVEKAIDDGREYSVQVMPETSASRGSYPASSECDVLTRQALVVLNNAIDAEVGELVKESPSFADMRKNGILLVRVPASNDSVAFEQRSFSAQCLMLPLPHKGRRKETFIWKRVD